MVVAVANLAHQLPQVKERFAPRRINTERRCTQPIAQCYIGEGGVFNGGMLKLAQRNPGEILTRRAPGRGGCGLYEMQSETAEPLFPFAGKAFWPIGIIRMVSIICHLVKIGVVSMRVYKTSL